MSWSEGLIHSAPLVFTTFELLATDMVFIHRDSWYMFGAGVTYTAFNAVGTWAMGKPVYPAPIDWKNIPQTLVIYLLQAPVLYFINEMIATCTQKRRNFIEKGHQCHMDKDMESIDGLT